MLCVCLVICIYLHIRRIVVITNEYTRLEMLKEKREKNLCEKKKSFIFVVFASFTRRVVKKLKNLWISVKQNTVNKKH